MENQIMCGNKKCVPRTSICNGIFDCDDKSDEQQHCNCTDYANLNSLIFETLRYRKVFNIQIKFILLRSFSCILTIKLCNFIDNCLWGTWKETICDEKTNSKIASRKLLRGKAGNGTCGGKARKILPCMI